MLSYEKSVQKTLMKLTTKWLYEVAIFTGLQVRGKLHQTDPIKSSKKGSMNCLVRKGMNEVPTMKVKNGSFEEKIVVRN